MSSKMDLMYPDFDGTLQEILECDLKSEMDRIVAIANGGGDLMAELNAEALIPEEGFDDFDLRDDPHGLGFGFGFTLSPTTLYSDGFGFTTSRRKDHHGRIGLNELRLGKRSSSKSPWKSSVNGSSINAALSSFDEQYGLMVDPSSIVPVSVPSSTASSASGSETDPECIATDEDESESETLQGKLSAWIVPASSRSPSPEPEFDVDVDEDEVEYSIQSRGDKVTFHHSSNNNTGSSNISSNNNSSNSKNNNNNNNNHHHQNEGPPIKKRKQKHEPQPNSDGKIYPKPGFSYSCLIAMSLKNSKTGSLPVSEIYKFMCDHFPYFLTAPAGWKNSVRHNLSLNKCFEKIEKPGTGARKGCLWALNPAKIHKMDEEVQKWSRKDPLSIRKAMSDPENLELIEKGELKRDYSGTGASDEDDDDAGEFSESNPATPLTPAQIQARRTSRANSSDSTHGGSGSTGNVETYTITSSTAPTTSTISQIHAASSLPVRRIISSRPSDQRIGTTTVIDDSLEFGTITNVQGNYFANGTGYTLSFQNLANSPTTPIIIRRTPVK